jgi:hypothetical protein
MKIFIVFILLFISFNCSAQHLNTEINFQKKRVELYKDFIQDAKKNGIEKEFKNKYGDYLKWESTNFVNEVSVKSIWSKALIDVISPCSLKEFFENYCGDLDWARQTQYFPKQISEKDRFGTSSIPEVIHGGVQSVLSSVDSL